MWPLRPALVLGVVGLTLATGRATRTDRQAQPAADSLPNAISNDNRTPAGRQVGDTLVLRLVAQQVTWHLDGDEHPGFKVFAFAEDGSAPSVPGPLVRVRAGTAIRIAVRSALTDTMVVHGFGARAGKTRDSLVVAPGATTETSFSAERPGTYFYWAYTGSLGRKLERRFGRASQLSGAFVVDPPGGAADDRILVITGHVDLLDSDGQLLRNARGFPEREFVAFNGRSWPHTERLTYTLGDTIRWRIVNASYAPHAMHLHGFYFEVGGRGNNEEDTLYAPTDRRRAVTEPIAVGETMAIAWSPDRPGGWLFHCHMTSHFSPHPPVDPRAGLERAHDVHENDPDRHTLTGMGGLMLATTVRGHSASPPTNWGSARRLRLLVDSDSVPGETAPRFGFVLQIGADEPRRDSVPVPGPTIVLTRGQPTVIDVVNRTHEPTAVHWHGIELESYYDGVVGVGGEPPRVTPAIHPGTTFPVHITPKRAGTFIYHTHYAELRQQYGGLYGALVVLEKGERWDPDHDRVLIVSDARTGSRLMINGSPDPTRMSLRVGTTYRFRWINITAERARARMSLRRAGQPITWQVLAKDGWPAPKSAQATPSDNMVSVGETFDVMVRPETVGELSFEVRTSAGLLLVAMPVIVTR
ncbi:MAG TPA: multicopper oxidase domain-containing protein [Gemmatimonadales bacterium]|jgi:FtsP/CotA-like multicopper oxidase with cupredoxin domain